MSDLATMLTGDTESAFDFSTVEETRAIQATIIAGFSRLAELSSEQYGEEVTVADEIDGFIFAVHMANSFLGGVGDDNEPFFLEDALEDAETEPEA